MRWHPGLFLLALGICFTTSGDTSAGSGKELPTFEECTFHIPVESAPERRFRDYYEFFRVLKSIVQEHAIPKIDYAFNYTDFRGLSVLLYRDCGDKGKFRQILIEELLERHGAEKPIAVAEDRQAVVNYNPPRLYWPQFWSDVDLGIVGSPRNPVDMDKISQECRASAYFVFDEQTSSESFDRTGSQIFKFATDLVYKELAWGFIVFVGSFPPDYKMATIDFGFLENCQARIQIMSGIFELSKQLKADGNRSYWSNWEAAGLKEYSSEAME